MPLTRGLAFFLLIIMGAMWGLQFAMLKMSGGGGYPEPVVLLIALGALSVIYGLMVFPNLRAFPFRWDVFRFLALASILGYAIPILAVLYAAHALPAGLLSMFACASPIVALLLAAVLRTERVTPSRVLAVILGVASITLVVGPELRLDGSGDTIWMLVALFVPIAFGIESVYLAAKWPKGLSALQAVTGETFIAALSVVPLVLFNGYGLPTSWTWTPAEIAIAVFVGAGVVESLIYFFLIQKTGAVFVNFGTFIALFAGIAWGIVLFAEAHGPTIWVAVAVLSAALFLASRD